MVHPGSSAGSEPWKRGLDGSTHLFKAAAETWSPISLFPSRAFAIIMAVDRPCNRFTASLVSNFGSRRPETMALASNRGNAP